MALKIRLRQQGRRNRLVYRLVLSDSRSPRDGKYIELLGWYNPHELEGEKHLNVLEGRLQHWLDKGAILTEKAEFLVKRSAPEVIQSLQKKRLEVKAKVCSKKKASRKKKTGSAA